MINLDPDGKKVGDPIVTVEMPLSGAKALSEAMSDLLCWSRGFIAAIPDDVGRHPMGIEELREFRIHLNKQIEEPF